MHDNPEYLQSQLITYLGNKRKLLPFINEEIGSIRQSLGGRKLHTLDIFSGSGCVSRLLKGHSESLTVNDMEKYAEKISSCYLTNKSDFPQKLYKECAQVIDDALKNPIEGVICANYAPKDPNNIKPGERVFYTPENARIIDTARAAIDKLPENMQKFFLAPLLAEASVHTNTSGVFKGFYKSKSTGIGAFGGEGGNALSRIMGKIELNPPVLSDHECVCHIFREDANLLAPKLSHMDLCYIDPPYDQHPYGSNYFMLNVICDNKLEGKISRVSGIPEIWNRSQYNKKAYASKAFKELIHTLDCEYFIISYNSEGFISLPEMTALLESFGEVKCRSIEYNTFRGSRNLRERDIHVDEYLFALHKKEGK